MGIDLIDELRTWHISICCPYCGFNNAVPILEIGTFSKPWIYLCGSDNGGCDKFFVVETRLDIKIKTHKLDLNEDNENEKLDIV